MTTRVVNRHNHQSRVRSFWNLRCNGLSRAELFSLTLVGAGLLGCDSMWDGIKSKVRSLFISFAMHLDEIKHRFCALFAVEPLTDTGLSVPLFLILYDDLDKNDSPVTDVVPENWPV
jgi:hypothetical protein